MTKASATDLKVDNLTAFNLSGGLGNSSTGEVFALKALSSTSSPSAYIENLSVHYTATATTLSSTNLTGGPGNLVVQGNNTIEIANLKASHLTALTANISAIYAGAGGNTGTT